eukprot:SAG11_NODE_8457_length_1013_cov_1.003282_1_plen_49_part_00
MAYVRALHYKATIDTHYMHGAESVCQYFDLDTRPRMLSNFVNIFFIRV